MTDPMDQPDDEDGFSLVYPFIACASHGGPYDDDAFVAGVQLGRIDQALQLAGPLNVSRLGPFNVRPEILRTVELAGMARGFPYMTADPWGDGTNWVTITFADTREEDR